MSSFHINGSNSSSLLLDQLLNASNKNRVYELCAARSADVLAHFKEWSDIPHDVKNDKAKLDWYGKGLVTIAVCMAELGFPQCVEILRGGVSATLESVQELCARAQQQSKAGDNEGAIKTLLSVVHQLENQKTRDAVILLPRILGLLGTSFLKTGNKQYAAMYTEAAIKQCVMNGDAEGEKVYRQNLQYIQSL